MKATVLMYRRIAVIPIAVSLLMAAAPVGAQAPERMPATVRGEVAVAVPQAAIEHADVISLGTAVDPQTGRLVEGLAIIHRRKGHAKPDHPGGGHGGGSTTSSCYAYLAKGASWKTHEDYVVDPSNTRGLSDASVRSIIADGIAQWEDATDGILDGSGSDVFGNEVPGVVDRADIEGLDGQNDVMFGSIAEPGVIAVTYVWGIFSGPPQGREIVEWNQVYDDADFDWSDTGAADAMDFENIATHELGHAFGMGHPDSTCTQETMYAYADYGEIIKRDLHDGDITGIDGLY